MYKRYVEFRLHEDGVWHLNKYSTRDIWTLSKLELSPPVAKTNFIAVPGRLSGPLDLSFSLTNGEPVYDSRKLQIVLETSEGSREDRTLWIQEIQNALDGRKADILLPDDHYSWYVTGRLSTAIQYNTPAHAAVAIEGVCEPWRYAEVENRVKLTATGVEQTVWLGNDGRLAVVPTVQILGTNAEVRLSMEGKHWSLRTGTHLMPDMMLSHGWHSLTYSGSGQIEICYRRGVL